MALPREHLLDELATAYVQIVVQIPAKNRLTSEAIEAILKASRARLRQ
jgi:hypothetical protein